MGRAGTLRRRGIGRGPAGRRGAGEHGLTPTEAAERAARESFGRLVALLACRSGDIAGAEDALAEAFASALATWPARGVPDNPDAWLLTAARRNLGHARARRASARAGEDILMLLEDERAEAGDTVFADRRLGLMFACTHPAIAADAQAPLMLQTVLGLDAARIAAAFLVSPAAMGQKLVRAKVRIREGGVPFDIPEAADLPARLDAVLDAIYVAYGTGWEDVLGADPKCRDLTGEAIWLARVVLANLSDSPEAMGLLSLMLHCEARKGARRDPDGNFVPLDRQDPRDWSHDMIVEAEALLHGAARKAVPGRFQTEAAIQSLHAQSRMTGEPLRDQLATLYDLLVILAPSTGARVARSVAHGEAGHIDEALAMLEPIDAPAYQPLAAAQARLLYLSGDTTAAQVAAARAAGLSGDPAVKAFLLSGGLFTRRGGSA